MDGSQEKQQQKKTITDETTRKGTNELCQCVVSEQFFWKKMFCGQTKKIEFFWQCTPTLFTDGKINFIRKGASY